jgi:hypothetical protein
MPGVTKKTDHPIKIRKMSFNWHECRSWLYYYTIWKLITYVYRLKKTAYLCFTGVSLIGSGRNNVKDL